MSNTEPQAASNPQTPEPAAAPAIVTEDAADTPRNASETGATTIPVKRVRVLNVRAFISLKRLIQDAEKSDIDAKFISKQSPERSRRWRSMTIVAPTEEAMEKAKAFFVDWYNNYEYTPRKKAANVNATNSEANGAASGEAQDPAAKPADAEPTDAASTADTATPSKPKTEKLGEKQVRKIEFADSTDPSKRRERRAAKAKSQKSTESSSKDASPASGPESISNSNGRGRDSKQQRSLKSGDNKQVSVEAGEGETAGEGQRRNGRNARHSGPRPLVQRIPEPTKVAVRVPHETTVEQVRELLPNFDKVEISLKRAFRRQGRSRENMHFLAIIDVGDGNQERAIEILKTQKLHGTELDPQVAYSRQQIAQEEARVEAQDPEANTDNRQPQVEHVENK